MEHKHAMVINKEGMKVEFVLVEISEEEGFRAEVPHAYILKEGERLVYDDIEKALPMCKPQWKGGKWIEKATPEEIEEARRQMLAPMGMSEPMPITPNPTDLALAEITELVVTNQLQTDLAIAELATLITGG